MRLDTFDYKGSDVYSFVCCLHEEVYYFFRREILTLMTVLSMESETLIKEDAAKLDMK